MNTGFGAERCAPGSCEAAKNANSTAAAASSPVAIRPTAISFSMDFSEPSLVMPAVQEDAKSTELGHVGASLISSF